MIKLYAGAQRPATGDARMARLAAANELVQRTLAQHGLASPMADGLPAGTPGSLPTIAGLLSRYDGPLGQPVQADVPIPEGARFLRDTFTCSAGSRDFRTYIPASGTDGVTGLVVMLHGCTQTPEDFAAGTGMNALAEKHRLIVVYPRQSRGDNAQSCWNWFSQGDQQRNRGEPAILAGLARKVAAEWGLTDDRTFVAGLSAGAAMAVILGEAYPDVFSAVGAHSGLPYCAARDVASAFSAMSGNVQERKETRSQATGLRTIVFHGTADGTVHQSNAVRIAEQALANVSDRTITTEDRGSIAGRSFIRTVTATPGGRIELETWSIEGLGHAWSGGQQGGSFTDRQGPDASAEMIRFFIDSTDREN